METLKNPHRIEEALNHTAYIMALRDCDVWGAGLHLNAQREAKQKADLWDILAKISEPMNGSVD